MSSTAFYFFSSLATTAAVHSLESLWPGKYELQMEVFDAQGLSCPVHEVFTLDVCTCVDTEDCGTRRTGALKGDGTTTTTSTNFGGPAIGLMLVGICLLMCELSFSKHTSTD